VASRSASAYIEQQVLKKEWPHNWRVVHTQGEPDPDHVGRVWVKTIADPAEKQHLGKRIAFVDCTVDLAQSPQEKDRIFNCTSSFTRSR
jgi:hypothetical protein